MNLTQHLEEIEREFDEKFADDATTSKTALKMHIKSFYRTQTIALIEKVAGEIKKKAHEESYFYGSVTNELAITLEKLNTILSHLRTEVEGLKDN